MNTYATAERDREMLMLAVGALMTADLIDQPGLERVLEVLKQYLGITSR